MLLYLSLTLLVALASARIREEPCWSQYGGHCQSTCHSLGERMSGKCPSQSAAIKCCVPEDEGDCTAKGGTCRFEDTPCSGGAYESGLCPRQPSGVKCCVPEGGSSGDETSSGILPTFSEFRAASQACGYAAPSKAKYDGLVEGSDGGGITSKREMAMFLAQVFYETAGLYYMREISPSKSYAQPSCDAPGKKYFGRGYIQLTWCENYKRASESIFGDDRLVTNPDQVASSEKLAWQVSFWYWQTRVHRYVTSGQFGKATRHINGGQCTATRLHYKAKERFACYEKVFEKLGVEGTPNETGCYN